MVVQWYEKVSMAEIFYLNNGMQGNNDKETD